MYLSLHPIFLFYGTSDYLNSSLILDDIAFIFRLFYFACGYILTLVFAGIKSSKNIHILNEYIDVSLNETIWN